MLTRSRTKRAIRKESGSLGSTVAVKVQYEEWSIQDLQNPLKALDKPIKWTRRDMKALTDAVNSVPPLTTNFWQAVAREMGTGHSASACQAKFTENLKKPQRPAKKTSEAKPKPSTVTGVTSRRGTMKRRRQFREAMMHLDKAGSDDVFESSPMIRRTKPLLIPEESEDYSSDCHSDASNGMTPTAADSWRARLGAPVTHTPPLLSSHLFSPLHTTLSLRERNGADRIMHHIGKCKRSRHKAPSKEEADPGGIEASRGRGKKNSKPIKWDQKLNSVRTTFQFHDSDSEDDEESDQF